jgi:hypothetical protein
MRDSSYEGPYRGSGVPEQTDGRRDVQGLRLIERAAREQWDISEAMRAKLLARLEAVLDDPRSSRREVAVVGRTISALSQINISSVSMTIKADEHENMAKRLDQMEELSREPGVDW